MLSALYTTEAFSHIFTCTTGPLEEHKRLVWLTEPLVRRGVALRQLCDSGLGVALLEIAQTAEDSTVAARASEQLKSVEHDESLVSSLRANECTYARTQQNPVCQMLYACESCGLCEGLVACAACAAMCHKGHAFSERLMGLGYCDCRSTCADKCVASKKAVEP